MADDDMAFEKFSRAITQLLTNLNRKLFALYDKCRYTKVQCPVKAAHLLRVLRHNRQVLNSTQQSYNECSYPMLIYWFHSRARKHALLTSLSQNELILDEV